MRWLLGGVCLFILAPLLLMMVVASATSSSLPQLEGKTLLFVGHVIESGRTTFADVPFVVVYIDELSIEVKCYGSGRVLGLSAGQRVAIKGVATGFFKGIGGSLQPCEVLAAR